MTAGAAELTVVSYNIRAAIGPGPFPAAWWRHVDRSRFEEIARVVAELRPDVVSLQEVALMTVDGVVTDQATELGRLTGLEVRYGATGHFPIVDPDSGAPIGASFWGNAILSRLPVRASRTVALPVASDDDLVEPAESALELAGVRYADAPVGVRELRCLLVCDLEVPGGTVHVASTHLTHVGSGQRLVQAGRVAEAIAELPGAVVLGGDLNGPVESDELRPLTTALVDAFTATGVPPTDPRRASCGPVAIDHVLTRGLTPLSCRTVAEAGEASDHLPVAATLAL